MTGFFGQIGDTSLTDLMDDVQRVNFKMTEEYVRLRRQVYGPLERKIIEINQREETKMTTWKEKYPIGSQWECRDGSRAVVVQSHPLVSYIDGGLYYMDAETGKYRRCHVDVVDLIKPWKEKRTHKESMALVEDLKGNINVLPLISAEYFDGVKVIGRKTVTITEGEGMEDE